MNTGEPTPDLAAIKEILKGVMAASLNGYAQPKVVIVSPHGHGGMYYLKDFGDHHVAVEGPDGSILFFPVTYVDYVIALDRIPL